MAISLLSNILSLRSQRHLELGSTRLNKIFEQLSSGQRINRASDDAAGLSLSSSLSAKARVFGQGVRNINDGISALNIVDGSLSSLNDILTRQRELAVQAANGALSRTQRLSLETEADALTTEYNRIVSTTSFNGLSLLGSSFGQLRIQGGFGLEGSLNINVGASLKTTKGTGSFNAFSTASTATSTDKIVLADVNSDSILDLVSAGSSGAGGSVQVKLGNGDGTFASATSLADTFSATYSGSQIDLIVDEVNGTGGVDLLVVMNDGVSGTGQVWLYSGNNNGTFAAETSLFSSGTGSSSYSRIEYTDLDGDNKKDFLVLDGGEGLVNFYKGNGAGGFTYQSSLNQFYSNFILADIDGDGKKDIAATNTSGSLQILLGNGNFTFQAPISTSLASAANSLVAADFNRDGFIDIATTHATSVDIRYGNGNGTFRTGATYSTNPGGAKDGIKITDLNSDGIIDLVTNSQILLGSTDGSFTNPSSYGGSNVFALGDNNRDGVMDIFSSTTSYLQNTESSANSQYLNLSTAADARSAIDTIDAILNRLSLERGSIGSSQSRLQSFLNTATATTDNYIAAESAIKDVDVAASAASLVREQILQSTTTALLAQANQAPAIALYLLQN